MSLKSSRALLELNIQRHVFEYEIVNVQSFYLHVKQFVPFIQEINLRAIKTCKRIYLKQTFKRTSSIAFRNISL